MNFSVLHSRLVLDSSRLNEAAAHDKFSQQQMTRGNSQESRSAVGVY